MTRPLRIEFAGAHYHVTSCGDGQEDIYLDDKNAIFSKEAGCKIYQLL